MTLPVPLHLAFRGRGYGVPDDTDLVTGLERAIATRSARARDSIYVRIMEISLFTGM